MCALFTRAPIAAVATQLLLLQYLGIFLCEWVVFLGEWIPSQASQQLYKWNLHGEIKIITGTYVGR